MKKIYKFRLLLGILAFTHMMFISTGIVFAPFGFLNEAVIFGNFFFFMLNAMIMGATFVDNKLKGDQNQDEKTKQKAMV